MASFGMMHSSGSRKILASISRYDKICRTKASCLCWGLPYRAGSRQAPLRVQVRTASSVGRASTRNEGEVGDEMNDVCPPESRFGDRADPPQSCKPKPPKLGPGTSMMSSAMRNSGAAQMQNFECMSVSGVALAFDALAHHIACSS